LAGCCHRDDSHRDEVIALAVRGAAACMADRAVVAGVGSGFACSVIG
jgi:hypothetical protein